MVEAVVDLKCEQKLCKISPYKIVLEITLAIQMTLLL